MNKNREQQWLLNEKYGGVEAPGFFHDMRRVAQGEPIDYVIGFSRFLSCEVDLSARPLIPRMETEYWVEFAVCDVQRRFGRAPRCLDLFAGSGCIGCAVLKHIPHSQVMFAEKYKRFLPGIRSTLKRNKISLRRASFIKSDVFSGVRGRFHCVFANPPYVAETRRVKVDASVLKFEPRAAIFAGRDGFRYIDKTLSEVRNYLLPGGCLYMEFNSSQRVALKTRLRAQGYTDFEIRKDQYKQWRWVAVRS